MSLFNRNAKKITEYSRSKHTWGLCTSYSPAKLMERQTGIYTVARIRKENPYIPVHLLGGVVVPGELVIVGNEASIWIETPLTVSNRIMVGVRTLRDLVDVLNGHKYFLA